MNLGSQRRRQRLLSLDSPRELRAKLSKKILLQAFRQSPSQQKTKNQYQVDCVMYVLQGLHLMEHINMVASLLYFLYNKKTTLCTYFGYFSHQFFIISIKYLMNNNPQPQMDCNQNAPLASQASKPNDRQVYFYKQRPFSLMCGLHAVNHLIGESFFTQNDFDQICEDLSDDFINPHKHFFGGDYDANVLLIALLRKGYQNQWHDRRKIFKFDESEQGKLCGYLINIKYPKKLYHKILGLSARHWMIIKQYEGVYYEVDSTCESINPIGNPAQVEKRIRKYLGEEAELIRVFQ